MTVNEFFEDFEQESLKLQFCIVATHHLSPGREVLWVRERRLVLLLNLGSSVFREFILALLEFLPSRICCSNLQMYSS